MDNMITEARKFMSSDEGKDMMDTFKQVCRTPRSFSSLLSHPFGSFLVHLR